MHEFSIAIEIVEIAIHSADQSGLKSVSCVEIEVGKASGIEPSALEFAWESARKNTILKDARLAMHFVPLRLECRTCGNRFETEEIYNPCPFCGEFNSLIISGKELKVTAIES